MTALIDSYIKDIMASCITFYGDDNDFECLFDDALQDTFNNYEDYWDNYGKPTLDEFMLVQRAAFDYLEGCDSLDLITEKVRDWKWWFNIYALSREWCPDMDELKEEVFVNCYEDVIIAFQANIRRRQATIRTIRKLHLTGTLF